jgi:hypothetical protein
MQEHRAMPQPGSESQTLTSADVGSMSAAILGSDGPATLDPAKAATPEEAAAADPHYHTPLAHTIAELQNLIPEVEVDIDIPDPAADPTENKTIKVKRMVPGFAFERKPNTASGEVVVALVERDGGDRISGKGKTTAEAVAALQAKLEQQGRLKP